MQWISHLNNSAMQRCAQHDEIQNHILDGTTLSALAHGRSQTHTTITGMAGIAMYLCLYIYCMYDVYVHRAVPCGTPFVQIGWLQKRTVVIYMNARHWTTLFDCDAVACPHCNGRLHTASPGQRQKQPKYCTFMSNTFVIAVVRIILFLIVCRYSDGRILALRQNWLEKGNSGWLETC